MNKQEFQTRAKNFAQVAKNSEQRVDNHRTLESNREKHIEAIKQFDPQAAELERAFFAADDAFAEAELKLAKYYASKIEG